MTVSASQGSATSESPGAMGALDRPPKEVMAHLTRRMNRLEREVRWPASLISPPPWRVTAGGAATIPAGPGTDGRRAHPQEEGRSSIDSRTVRGMLRAA
jgi:hypothetical protein